MKLDELDKQITSSDLEALETFADRIFGKVGIDVEFTRHFLDRVNDTRNRKQITASELTRLFKQEYKRWGQPIAQMGPDAEAVMKDLSTDINMPFALVWDKENEELDLIVKTVMRKPDFKTSNREFPVESEYFIKGKDTLIPYVSMDWGLWKASQRGRISFDERLSEYIDNAGGQGSEGHMKMWSRFKKNHGIKSMTTDEKEETFLYQKMKSMKKWEYPKLEEEDAGLYYDNVKKKDYSKYKGEQIYELRQQLKSIRQTLLNLQDVDPKDGSSDMQNDIKGMLRGYDELTTAMGSAEDKLLGEGIAEDDLSELGRGLFSMGGRSGSRYTPTQSSTHRTISLPLRGEPKLRPAHSNNMFRRLLKLNKDNETDKETVNEDPDYTLMAQKATMNLSDQAIVALIADLYKQLDRQVNEETTQCTACDGTGWDRSVTSDEDDRGCDECGGTGEIEVLEEHNVQVKGSDPWPKAKPGRTDHPFIGKLVGSKYNEDSLADTRQKRIAIDTVRNPSKALLGGPSASEAEDILKTKFGFSDKDIANLKSTDSGLQKFDTTNEATQKPYVSMYRDKDNRNKMVYDVLDKYGNSAFKSYDKDEAQKYLKDNYESLREESQIWKFNKEDPNNPEVLIQGFGRLMLNQIEDSVIGKLEDLVQRAKGRRDWQQINANLDSEIMQIMIKAIVDTKKDLEKTRKRGGPKSRGINKDINYESKERTSILDVIGENTKVKEFEKDFSKLNEFTLVDVKDMIKKGWMSRPTEKQWKELIKIYNKYKGNVTRKDLIDVGIATLGRKESVKETGGVGKVVPGVNTSVDVGPNEIKKQAAKFGNDVDKDGVPKKNLR